MRISSKKKNIHFGSILILIILLSIIIIVNKKIIQNHLKEYILNNYEVLLIQDKRYVKNNIINGENKGEYIKRIIKKLPNYIMSPNNFSTIKINLEFKYLLKMREEINKSIEMNYIYNQNFYPVKIEYMGNNYDGEIRIKGILPADHILGNSRWSLKIKLLKDQYIDGHNEFIIQKPISRQFPYDHIFHEWIRFKNIITSTHDYKKIIFNGEKWGVMILESSYTQDFLEISKKKFAPVASYGNTNHWYLKKINSKKLEEFIENSKIGRSEVEFVNKKKLLKDEHLISLSQQLKTILLSNDINEKNIHNYFDMEKFGYLITASLIWQTFHALSFENIKFYINPYTLKIEPVVSDQSIINTYGTNKKLSKFNLNEPNKIILKIIFSEHYKKNFLKYFVELENDIPNLKKTQEKICKKFVIDCPQINEDIFLKNINEIKKKSHEELFGIFRIGQNKIKFQDHDLSEFNPGKIKILDILIQDKSLIIKNLIDSKIKILEIKFNNKIIPIQPIINPLDEHQLDIEKKLSMKKINDVKIVFKLNGHIKTFSQSDQVLISYGENNLILENYYNYSKYFNVVNNQLLLKNNINFIYENLIIPKNFIIKILPGQKILFNKNSFLISFSPIIAKGEKNNPITIKSSDEKINFKGIYILNSEKESIFENVFFENITEFSYKNIKLTGCVNFYNTKIKIVSTEFINTSCEDVINFVQSKYFVENLKINYTKSDAIDSDFSDGVISNSIFKNIGGDGIDLSGSNIKVNNLYIENVKDKAFSIGESSNAQIDKIFINNANIGLASKDGSEVIISFSEITNSKLYDLMAYEKKNFYGSSKISSLNNKINKKKVIATSNNIILIDEKIVAPEFLDVKKLYLNSL